MENLQIHKANVQDLYDLSMLEEMDDNEYLLDMISTLLHEVPKDFKEMKLALQTGEIDIVCKQAHKIKNSANVIQADKLIAILGDIETLGKNGAMAEELKHFVENALHQFNDIEKALKEYTNELK